MTLETKTDLSDQTIAKLQKLIRANIDSFDGFREAANEVDDKKIAALFVELADQRSAMASKLQKFVEFNGENSEDDGSVAAATHRIWMNIRSKLNGGDAYAVLAEAERGEDHIKAAYEDVLQETAGSAMNDVLTDQYRAVKAGHDKVRDLRDAYKAK
ncbi:PA2169 family four-helix-bundle protein [Allorhodopirellula heiligendammensis]|uniref:DUF2383 domain-containing protein n=1 Tax=Allorhodopirellula heiligendammensis TaxID=2714739 RepID=A0A5C6C112_9BACT|nr:PA2169 family four-helix-bundle protein [Allorhodopirellula heiligendammensis]TWU16539.1 hypothetical protein Poly21_37440 [Allorhodopirellula heiligendammensis]